MKKIICITLLTVLFISTNPVALDVANTSNINESENIATLYQQNKIYSLSAEGEDLDTVVDLEVTVTIKEIRSIMKRVL